MRLDSGGAEPGSKDVVSMLVTDVVDKVDWGAVEGEYSVSDASRCRLQRGVSRT